MANSARESSRQKSLLAVNLLFLLVFCLQVSNLLFLWLPQYVRLILNQVFFIFLPAYVYLRVTRQPVLEQVRWRWPGWKSALLALLIGMGLYPLSIVSAGVFQNLLGLTFEAPADAIPATAGMAVLAIIAYAVMAPLCEEFLFRGVIQPVYEGLSARWAVFFVGFLFILFHLSLVQGLSIILLALALGFVFLRTRSLPASILTHFGANLLAALVITSGVFKSPLPAVLFSLPVILGGVLLSLLALLLLVIVTRAPEPVPAPPAARLSLRTGWPLLAAVLIYLGLTGADFLQARAPAIISNPLQVNSAVWQQELTLRYEIKNIIDQPVGTGECQLRPGTGAVEVTCQSTTSAYEVQNAGGTWINAGGLRTDVLRWQASDGRLLEGRTSLNLRDGQFRAETSWVAQETGVRITYQENDQPGQEFFLLWNDFPRASEGSLLVVVDFLLPWQLAGMDLRAEVNGMVARFSPYAWRERSRDSGPIAEALSIIPAGWEELRITSGTINTRVVTVGERQTIWYALDGPPVPVRFFNGMETWTLIE